MGITEKQLCYEMTWVDYWEALEIFNRKRIRELSKHRNILAAITGRNPKFILELPGDWDDVPVHSQERAEKLMHKWNVHKLWTKEMNKDGRRKNIISKN
jgi:hypothetical protein